MEVTSTTTITDNKIANPSIQAVLTSPLKAIPIPNDKAPEARRIYRVKSSKDSITSYQNEVYGGSFREFCPKADNLSSKEAVFVSIPEVKLVYS